MKENLFHINNTMLVNTLKRDGCLYKLATPYSLKVFSKTNRATKKSWSINIEFRIDADGETFPIKPVDFLIMDAVYYLYCNEISPKISLRQIDGVLTGDRVSDKQHAVSENRLGMLKERIENLMKTRIRIDCTDEVKARKGKGVASCIIEGPLLPLEKAGRKYIITDEPPLYKYSDINGQVQHIPYNLFCARTSDGNSAVKNTLRNILIRYYLIHELEVIRCANSKYNLDKIPFLEVSKRSTQSDRGILTGLHQKEFFGDDRTDSVKCECIIRKTITTPAVRHSVSAVEKTVRNLLDFYKHEKYLESYSIIKNSKRSDMPECGLPEAVADIHFYQQSADSKAPDTAENQQSE